MNSMSRHAKRQYKVTIRDNMTATHALRAGNAYDSWFVVETISLIFWLLNETMNEARRRIYVRNVDSICKTHGGVEGLW